MWNDALWLKLPQKEIEEKKIFHGDMTGRFAYFRCEQTLPTGAQLTADITANSRYRLWVNGQPVLSGPCKGDMFRQYYETVCLTPFLVPGKNVFCAQVLYCDPDTAECQTDERASIYGVIGPKAGHRLAVQGEITDAAGSVIANITTGKEDWRVFLDNTFYLKSDPEITLYLGAVTEEIDFAKSPAHWKEPAFDAAGWRPAACAGLVRGGGKLETVGVQPRFRIREREIPLLYEKEDRFVRDFSRRDGKPLGLVERGSITVQPGQTLEVILDAGVHKNGYLQYRFEGGEGARVTITYFEKFGGAWTDLRRTDYENGAVSGLTDTITLPGTRSGAHSDTHSDTHSGEAITYEPFWMRTFRFVRIMVQAAAQPVRLFCPTFRKTGYPLQVDSGIRADAPWVGKLWEICVRTLENCMAETYMDCPYYEQLQFAMDTRLEALFTCAVSNDAALARKALIDFHYGMQPEGLTAGKYPSVYLQILSTFSLHYVMMLWEYYCHTGDLETVRLCRCDVDRIFDYYDAHIGPDGLVGQLEFWQFVDWQPDWSDRGGTPRALASGPSAIINLMYAYAMGCAVQLFEAAGRQGLAQEYTGRRRAILEKVQSLCWDEDRGMYREGPACRQFTQMAQAWAVLNDMADAAKAAAILKNAIADKTCLKCSFSTAYEWFRALEKAGLYDEMRTFLNDWIGLLELECTTCPETPQQARSECHAWSALPVFEMMRTMAGVRSAGLFWNWIEIAPHMMDLETLEGTAVTPKGVIRFHYQKQPDGKTKYFLQLPEEMCATLVCPDGRRFALQAGEQEVIA